MTNKSGYVTANVKELETLQRRLGLSRKEFIEASDVSPKTGYRVFRAEPVRMKSLKKLLAAHGEDDVSHYIDSGESEMRGVESRSIMTLDEWESVEIVGPTLEFPNGLQYRIHRLRHRLLPDTWGRGKEYDLRHQSTDEIKLNSEYFIRHSKVCRKFKHNPRFAKNERVVEVPGTKVYWVIDSWEASRQLTECLAAGPLEKEPLVTILGEILRAISDLHGHQIIRRDLSPDNVWVRDDNSVFLSDLELTKLLDGSPTVSSGWARDVYRAPEVGAETIDATVDFFSWAQILCHAVTGKTPRYGGTPDILRQYELPKAIKHMATRCLSSSFRGRPKNVAEILEVFSKW